jgi:hypothetical protein
MKKFLAYFAAALILIAGTVVCAAALLDTTGFRTYLALVLPFKSVPFSLALALVGVAYAVLVFIRSYALVGQFDKGNKKLSGYLADIGFGVAGFVLASATYVALPFVAVDGLVPTQFMWLLFVLKAVMTMCGFALSAASALAFTLAIPLSDAWTAYSLHQVEVNYRRR